MLVDAPCSSTGVIRRHPDIKLLRRSTDIAAFAITQARILAKARGPIFLNPFADSHDTGFQTVQGLTAIGSGGKTGRGDDSTQTRLDFVPERHTDFIFAVIGERYGFMGAALVLSLYALLFWRALRITTLSKNSYGTLIAGGIAVSLLFQTFVNVGMNLGIMPITGIPLPLLSYGGSSVLATLLAVGVLQSINVQAHLGQKGRFAW